MWRERSESESSYVEPIDEDEVDYNVYLGDSDDEDAYLPHQVDTKCIYNAKSQIDDAQDVERDMDEAISKAKNLAKRLATSFDSEADEIRRSSKKHDAVTLNHAYCYTSPDVIPSSKQPVSYSDKYRQMDGHRPTDVSARSCSTDILSRKNFWWRENDSDDTKLTAREKRNRIEERLNGILDYEEPGRKNYASVRNSLRNIEDKLEKHRRLTDRYLQVDLDEKKDSCMEDRVNKMADRFDKRLNAVNEKTDEQKEMYYYSPLTTLGYAGGLTINDGSQTSELRGRLRRLICRSKKNPHYYRY